MPTTINGSSCLLRLLLTLAVVAAFGFFLFLRSGAIPLAMSAVSEANSPARATASPLPRASSAAKASAGVVPTASPTVPVMILVKEDDLGSEDATPPSDVKEPPVPPQAPTPRPYSGPSRLTLLILGVDERGEQVGQPTRTDMMMVARIDMNLKKVAALSIPRDLWVTIPNVAVPSCTPGQSQQKITTAHFWGTYCGYEGGGIQLARDTVEYNLGLKSDHYIRVNFRGFQHLIDSVGGIDVHVDKEIYDERCPAGPDKKDGVVELHLTPGWYHMHGELALQYVRTRHSDSDFGRMARQQQVMLAIREKVLKPEVWPGLPDIVRALWDTVETDLGLDEMISLLWTGRDISGDNISVGSIDESMISNGWSTDGQQILIANWPEVHRLVQDTFP
jgi:polyisoprenyl-teichoic acid--peptidoglycan teichoic acid transferase